MNAVNGALANVFGQAVALIPALGGVPAGHVAPLAPAGPAAPALPVPTTSRNEDEDQDEDEEATEDLD